MDIFYRLLGRSGAESPIFDGRERSTHTPSKAYQALGGLEDAHRHPWLGLDKPLSGIAMLPWRGSGSSATPLCGVESLFHGTQE